MIDLRDDFIHYLCHLMAVCGIKPAAQREWLERVWVGCAMGGPLPATHEDVTRCFRLLCVIEGALFGPKAGYKDTVIS